MQKVLSFLKRGGVPVAVGFASMALVPAAFAAGPDFSVLTAGVDFSTVNTGILAIGALLGGVLVCIVGAKMILGFLRK